MPKIEMELRPLLGAVAFNANGYNLPKTAVGNFLLELSMAGFITE